MEAIEPARSPGSPLPAAVTPPSAVSWGAILVGALIATAVSLILLTLGSGLGFAAISPQPNEGASPTGSAVMVSIWLVIMQWASAGIGGFITGRLRLRWIGTHVHEVFFRDTAHGLATWALSTVVVASLAFAGLSSALGFAVHAAGAATVGEAQGAVRGAGAEFRVSPYAIDTLLRSENPDPALPNARAQVARILANGLASGSVPDADRRYLAAMVAARSGLSETDAQRRVDELIAKTKAAEMKARETADKARKAAAQASILAALSMLVGAFIACVAAALGGRHRDQHP